MKNAIFLAVLALIAIIAWRVFHRVSMMKTYRRFKVRLAQEHHLRITCANCGTRFVLGVDSKLLTHEELEAQDKEVLHSSTGAVPPGVSARPHQKIDLVVCKELSFEERQKTIRDLEAIYQDLCSGVARGWCCGIGKGDCDGFVNAYPLQK